MMTPEQLDDFVIFSESDGTMVARIGMLVTLYIKEPHTRTVRLSAADCIQEYLEMAGSQLRWSALGNAARYSRYEANSSRVAEFIEKLDEQHSFEMDATGASEPEQASSYSLKVLLGAKAARDVGFISASVPVGLLLQKQRGFTQEWILRWCQRLSPTHGYAGLALVCSVDNMAPRAAGPVLYPYAKRFPGLEIDNPITQSRYCFDAIKGVNWLTAVSDELLSRIGGREALRTALSGEFILREYPGGVLVQAGPHPQIGDVEQGNIPWHYQTLYRQLKPLQTDYPDVLIFTPDDVDPIAFAREWMHRFD